MSSRALSVEVRVREALRRTPRVFGSAPVARAAWRACSRAGFLVTVLRCWLPARMFHQVPARGRPSRSQFLHRARVRDRRPRQEALEIGVKHRPRLAMRASRCLTAVAISSLAACALVSSRAHADALAVPPGARVEETSFRAAISHSGRVESMIDEIEITSGAPTFVWMRAFPSEPRIREADPSVFDELDELTEVPEPHNEMIRRRLFGPSIVTFLSEKLSPPREIDRARGPTRAPPRRLRLSDIRTWRLSDTSTTASRARVPPDLVELVEGRGLALDSATTRGIQRYLNRGWVIVSAIVEDPDPDAGAPSRLGPYLFEFETQAPVYPIGLGDPAGGRPFRIYMIGDAALTPTTHRTAWDERPWDPEPRSRDVFFATYHQAIDPEGAIHFQLAQNGGLRIPENARIVRTDFLSSTAPLTEIELAPSARSVSLPARSSKGSTTDLLFCVLLGLTPLLYTPESWFLLWLGRRTRERSRGRPSTSGSGIRVWWLYALTVSAFWLTTLERTGRIAAVLPALVGILAIALPRADPDSKPIRSDLGRTRERRRPPRH